ncbi:hypothetical protein FQA39_LY05551 [Lamprigera yunnana]|nr:hypothetical protein FQA39_LY05551 [Lamprigera yunnana]
MDNRREIIRSRLEEETEVMQQHAYQTAAGKVATKKLDTTAENNKDSPTDATVALPTTKAAEHLKTTTTTTPKNKSQSKLLPQKKKRAPPKLKTTKWEKKPEYSKAKPMNGKNRFHIFCTKSYQRNGSSPTGVCDVLAYNGAQDNEFFVTEYDEFVQVLFEDLATPEAMDNRREIIRSRLEEETEVMQQHAYQTAAGEVATKKLDTTAENNKDSPTDATVALPTTRAAEHLKTTTTTTPKKKRQSKLLPQKKKRAPPKLKTTKWETKPEYPKAKPMNEKNRFHIFCTKSYQRNGSSPTGVCDVLAYNGAQDNEFFVTKYDEFVQVLFEDLATPEAMDNRREIIRSRLEEETEVMQQHAYQTAAGEVATKKLDTTAENNKDSPTDATVALPTTKAAEHLKTTTTTTPKNKSQSKLLPQKKKRAPPKLKTTKWETKPEYSKAKPMNGKNSAYADDLTVLVEAKTEWELMQIGRLDNSEYGPCGPKKRQPFSAGVKRSKEYVSYFADHIKHYTKNYHSHYRESKRCLEAETVTNVILYAASVWINMLKIEEYKS